MSKIDLHIHSYFSSDGEFAPREIIARCKALDMELVAIVDHNSVKGVAEAVDAAGELRVISGVELDCVYKGRNFHLLGYNFDYTREEFDSVEQDILRQERDAAKEKIRLFKNVTGLPVNEEEVFAAADKGVVTGELIAQILLDREDAGQYEELRPYLPGGAKSDMPNVRFYWDFFSEGKPAYVPIHYLSLRDAANLIHSTGGIAVLAHPGQNLGGDDQLLEGIISEKIEGIEVFSSYHSRQEAAHYLNFAMRNNLLVTCGSDFHGRHKPNIVLGGHGAQWKDHELLAGIEKELLKQA